MDAIKKHIPIFYSCDEKYAPLAMISMASILFNTKSYIDFYVLHNNVTEKTINKFYMLSDKFHNFSLKFINVNTSEYFDKIELRNHVTNSCFSRFLIPSLEPKLDKVIYLDCDTIILQDIEQLYNQELNGYPLGAVVSQDFLDFPDKKQEVYKAALLSPTHLYFNSGVLLIDIQKWIQGNALQKLLEAEKVTAETRYFNDQDILNNAFDSNFQPLDLKFNVRTSLFTMYEIHDIAIRHFTGNLKPWVKIGFMIPHASDFWFYAQMTPVFAETLINAIGELPNINVNKVFEI